MVLVVTGDGISTHSGTICGSDVLGTVTVGSNDFVFIDNSLMMVIDGTMEVPDHNNPPCVPPNILSHSFTADITQQSFVTIGDVPVSLVGDNYSTDQTDITGAGQTFVEVEL